MSRKIIFAAISFFCISGVAFAEPPEWYFSSELLYVEMSGRVDATFLGHATSESRKNFAPRFAIGRFLNDSWALEFSYTYLDAVKTDWVSPLATIFPGIPSATVVTNWLVKERMHIPAISLLHQFRLGDGVTLRAGPSLSYFINQMYVYAYGSGPEPGVRVLNSNPAYKWTEEDFVGGLDVMLDLHLSKGLSFGAGYHYLNAPHREIHLVGASAVLRF